MNARMWFEAARPKTWSAALVPVLVGTATADRIFVWRALGAMTVSLSLQIGVNFANDYFDGIRGIDDERTAGPRRLTASGVASHRAMKIAISVALSVAMVGGAALAYAVGWELLLVGLAALIAALAYSGGPRPYASAGLGEVFVFVFFGLVATAGSRYVHTQDLPYPIWIAGSAVGALATAILLANNLRDIASDSRSGKRTLAVRLGERHTRWIFHAAIAAAFALVPVLCLATGSWYPAIALAALPLARRASKTIRAGEAAAIAPALASTSRLHLVFGSLLSLGIWL